MSIKKLDTLVLAEGEVTGHAHRASSGVLYEKYGVLVLEPDENTVVTHEEHYQTPRITKSMRVERVQEFNHAEQEARYVLD